MSTTTSPHQSRWPEASPDNWEFDAPLKECPLCQSARLAPHDRDYLGRTVDCCRQCGLQFMNPQYSQNYLSWYYSQYYAQSVDEGRLVAGDPKSQTRQVAAKTERLRLLQDYVAPGRLLCIGCGDGLELRLARDAGWQPEGFDVDDTYMEQLSRQLDMPLYGGDLVSLNLPSGTYDAVFMDQVLEHPKQPRIYLQEARRLLRPGGILLVACPNLGSLANRWKTTLGRWGLKSRPGRHYDMFHHLFFYRPQVLKRLLQQEYGFEVVCVQGDPTGGRSKSTGSRFHAWQRRFPLLESSFRLLARKPAELRA
jgi:SAM-dependent methyltransferase